MDTPKTRYAQSADGTYIAFQVFGTGPDLLVAWPAISHLELFWEDPDVGGWLRSLARFSRVITLDQRGGGLSDRMTQTVNLETKMDDIRAVLDAAGSDRPVLYGQGVDGGAICAMFAATYPDRTAGLLLWRAETSGRGGDTNEELDAYDRMLEASWGEEDAAGPLLALMGAPTPAGDPVAVRRWARIMRNAASRGDALANSRVFVETDSAGSSARSTCPPRSCSPTTNSCRTRSGWRPRYPEPRSWSSRASPTTPLISPAPMTTSGPSSGS